jgi:cytochrome c oxidase cbb3-type subunit 4
MNGAEIYALRHFADGWGLAGHDAGFVVLCAWPFRPAGGRTDEAATMIFRRTTMFR